MEKAKIRANKEDERNRELITKSFGELVKYGDEIQLMHMDSKGFLAAKNECSKTEQIGYKLEIMKQATPRMVFTFEPRYKSHSIGETIQYSDDLILKNKLNNNNLSVSPLSLIPPKEAYAYDDNPYMYIECNK